MSNRKLLTAVVAILALTTYFSLRNSSSLSTFTMSSRASASVAATDITVKLSQSSVNPPTIKVTLQNTHPSSAVTVLSWDTPLDSQALNTGVFKLVDAESGEEVKGPGLKLNRLLPPPRNALVEIASNSEVTREVELKGSWLPKDGNKKFKLSALGAYKSIWAKSSSDVQQKDLEEAGGESAIKGYFKSDEVEITL